MNTEPQPQNILNVRAVLAHSNALADEDTIRAAAHEACSYHTPSGDMPARFAAVSKAIEDAVVALVQNCPPSGDRTAAIRQLLDARMVANRSISLNGVF